MNKILLSLVLTLTVSVLIILGVGVFEIMSYLFDSDIAVLGIGVSLLYIIIYASVNNTENGLESLKILEEDTDELL